jgi:translation initiation factor 1
MAKKDKKNIVYSTNPNYEYEFDEDEVMETLPPQKQTLKVMIDKKQRKGKAVTLIAGFVGSNDDLKDLGKFLKSKCGVGGSVKDREILIQGDHRDKIIEILNKENYKTKRVGG